MASAHRFGPRRSIAALTAQIPHPLQRCLKLMADRPGTLLQLGSVDRAVFVAVPQGK